MPRSAPALANLPTYLDLESLRCFLAAADGVSFREAAGRVHLSPAAFGERIRRLEELLDARLFERTTRRVDLTTAGRRLIPRAEATLHAATRCVESVHEDLRPPYALTLGTRHELGMSWLVPALGQLERDEPARQLHLDFGSGPALFERVIAGTLDAAIISLPIASAAVTHVALHREDYAFVGAAKLMRERPLRRSADASAHTLIDIRAGFPLFRYLMDATPPDVEWRFERHTYLGTIAAIRARVLKGAGVAVLPRYYVAKDLERARMVPVLPRITPRHDFFRLVWRTGHPFDAELRALAESLRQRPLR